MMKRMVRRAWLPISLLGLYLVFLPIYLSLGLPSPEQILEALREYFDRYGMKAVFIAAVLESLFMLSFYIPGSIIIVLSVLVSGGEVRDLLAIGFLCWLGFSIGMVVNYYLGYYGAYKALLLLGNQKIIDDTREWLRRNGRIAAFLSGFHPNFLAIVAVCYGIAKTSTVKTIVFLMLILAFWVPIAVVIAIFLIKTVNVAGDSQHIYVAGLFFIWAGALMAMEAVDAKRSKEAGLDRKWKGQ